MDRCVCMLACVCVCVCMTSWHMHISKLLYITGQGEKGRGYGEVRCVFCVTGSSSIWFSLVCAGKRREDVGLFDVSRVQVRSFSTWAVVKISPFLLRFSLSLHPLSLSLSLSLPLFCICRCLSLYMACLARGQRVCVCV